jgi:hypothetical protein
VTKQDLDFNIPCVTAVKVSEIVTDAGFLDFVFLTFFF